ncbi:MAG: OprD family outer membrane porin, partial [Deltaproteobacteria bacterium]|nr:OprD family outer membrane porin [Deltaproteobacteria bacterium]
GAAAFQAHASQAIPGGIRSRSQEEAGLTFWRFGSGNLLLVRTLALAVVLVIGPVGPVAFAADESVLIEAPPPRSVEEESGPLDRSFEDLPAPEPVFFPRAKRSLEDLPPVLRDTQLDLEFRTYYFRRRLNDNSDVEALAMGGWVKYRSGWLAEHLQVGATLFTSQKLVGPDRRDGTQLLKSRQRSYTVLGESFVRLRAVGHELTAYRHRIDLPFLNGNDSRMTPNTFEGFSLVRRHERIGYTFGHLLQMKRRNDDHFASFSEVAGVPGASSNGLSFAGFRIKPLKGLSLGAINQYVKDTFNTVYCEAEWVHQAEQGWGIRTATQFTHQRSVGDDRLTQDSFDTWVWGGKLAASWKQAMLSVTVSVTDDDQRIHNPYGSYPGYLAMMQRNFNDANEKAWGLGASAYFGEIGVPDLSLALRYSEGYDRQRPLTDEHLGDRRELNATLDYRLRHGPLRGFWLRARFGWGHVEGTRRDSFEGRIVLRYDLKLL